MKRVRIHLLSRRPLPDTAVRLALPKGRMQDNILKLFADAGVRLTFDRRGYRPTLSLGGYDAKILKPQNIVEMLDAGSRDLGFAGADWVAEKGADLAELLDTGLDPVRIVAAGAPAFVERAASRPFTIASEYERLATAWIKGRGYDAKVVRTYGATEVFPPDDADCIVDNTATGATLKANGLVVFDELMVSTTRLYAHKQALDRPEKRDAIEHLVLLLRSVLDARERVMIEVNVGPNDLEGVVGVLPCMREPTIARLHHDAGFAVKAAVPQADLPGIIRRVKAAGGSDIIVFQIAQIVP